MRDRAAGLTFDQAPLLYERHRPVYPVRAIDELVERASLTRGSRVLEVGAGTGQATMALVARDLSVTALEPGPRAAARLAKRLRPYPSAVVVEARFEDAALPHAQFDLVLAAQSFHWIDPSVRLTLAASALRDGGYLAIMRNDHALGPGNRRYHDEVRQIYEREAPDLLPVVRAPEAASLLGLGEEYSVDHEFEVRAELRFGWDQSYSSRGFVDLLRTQSHHRLVPRARRARLMLAIERLIDGSLGGRLDDHYVTRLCIARRR